MTIIEQLMELFSGHSETLSNARNSLDRALEENRKATVMLRELAEHEHKRLKEAEGENGAGLKRGD